VNDNLDWRQRGACRDEDPELFHPVGTSGPAVAQLEEAKMVCGWCPVRQECLDDAMRIGVEYGVYGGMSETERRELRSRDARPGEKRKRIPPTRPQCGSEAGAAAHRRRKEPLCDHCRREATWARARRAGASS
jgi:WhiB family redox-sensing transcriptional regulator